MKNMIQSLLITLTVASVAFCLGCSSPTAAELPTHPVSGTVTLGGQPVEGATVTFLPVDTKAGMPAVGKSDAAGEYTLTTQSSSGALVGDYTVKIDKFKEEAAASGGGAYSDDAYTKAQEAGGSGPPPEQKGPENLLPAKYADPGTSGLKATVSAGSNTIDFPLEG